MTSNLLENVQVYFLSHVLTRYACCILAIRRKLEYVFKINNNIKKSDVENLKNLFLFHGLLYYLSEKRIKVWGHRTNSLSGGPNLTPPLKVPCVFQYKKFWNAHFGHFGDVILLVYEAI